MKKVKQTLFILIFILALTLLAGCKDEPHVHTFEEKWTYDKDGHWHAASCGHTEEKSDEAAHDKITTTIREATETEDGLVKITCSVCGYSEEKTVKYDHTHTFSKDWETDENYHWHAATCEHTEEKSDVAAHNKVTTTIREATETEDGLVKITCSVCGYSEEKTVKYSHTHTFSTDWEADETYHWHKADCGHDVVDKKGEHDFVSASTADCSKVEEISYTCSVCGYEKKITERGKHNFDENDICTVCKGYKCGDDVAAIFDETAKTLTVRGTGDMYDYTYSDYTAGKIKWKSLDYDKLIIEDGVTSIGEYSFYESAAKSAEIGKDVQVIKYISFGYAKLTSLDFSENSALYKIGNYALTNTLLSSVELPSSVRILGTGAFQGCSNLTDLKLNEGLQGISSDIILATSVTELHLPSTYNPGLNSYYFPTFWSNNKLTTITVAEGNPYVKAIDGILYSIDGEKLIGVPGGKTSIAIAETVVTIGKSAFFYWNGTSVTLPESVTTIENSAFRKCVNLESVSMGSKVKSIDETAFDYTPQNVATLTITISQLEGSIPGYETCWRKNKKTETKAIEIKWTGTTSAT